MSDLSMMDIHHPDYDLTVESVRLIRDAVEGSNAIKNGERADLYLPNPTDSEILTGQDRKEATARYNAYKLRAEYDNFPSRTESGYMGALGSTPVDFAEIPTEVEYLLNNSDGDGLSLAESIQITQSNLLEVKYHGLLVDFNGLVNFDDDSFERTNQQAEQMGLKASIKHYPRESIVDWDFGSVNGVNQLTYVKLVEQVSQIDPVTLVRVTVDNQLALFLDENGEYYQRQIVIGESDEEQMTEAKYPEANGQRLDFIPIKIVIDQQKEAAKIPKGFGILYPVCLKAIERYQVKADLKEMLHKTGQPTSWSSGWTAQNFDMYKQLTGRETVGLGSGSHIPLPKDSEIGYLQWDADSNGLFKYLEENQKEAKALGARFDTSQAQDEAVGVAQLRSTEELSALVNIQESIKEAYEEVLAWAYLFMSRSQVEPNIEINLNKEFNKVKMTPQERKAIQDDVMAGIIDKSEALAQLEKGGVLTEEADALLNRMDMNIDE